MKVKAKIDGRPVDAVIVTDPWAEAARAMREFGDALAGFDFTEDVTIVDPKGRRRE